MLKNRSFQTRLFITYSAAVTVLVSISFWYFYNAYSNIILTGAFDQMDREADAIVQKLDNLVYTADRLAMQVKYNKQINDTFMQATFSVNPGRYFDLQEEEARRVQEVITSIIGVDPQLFYRVSVYNKSGDFVGVGAYYDQASIANHIPKLSWFDDLLNRDTYRLLIPPHIDQWDNTQKQVVSVIRKLQSPEYYGALIELQIPYEDIDRICMLAGGKGDTSVMVLDGSGQLIFPAATLTSPQQRQMAKQFNQRLSSTEANHIDMHTTQSEQELFSYRKASYSGWNVIISESKHALMAPIRKIQLFMLMFAALLVVVSLSILFFFTRRAVKPLKQLSKAMSKVQMESIGQEPVLYLFDAVDPRSTHNEIAHVYSAFRKMIHRLEESKEMVIQAEVRELKAHLVALQRQVNPHFLYNTLSMIGMLGRENGNEDVLNACSMLAGMFRYITYSDTSLVSLREELTHTENYLKLLHIRYGESLRYSMHVEEELLNLRLPKLIVQPIVENCIKHGFKQKKPPWVIRIEARRKGEGWQLLIEDNGSGFPDDIRSVDVLSSGKVRQWEAGTIDAEDQGGSGLRNAHVRLAYHYGEAAIMRWHNTEGGGACVVIGFRNNRAAAGN